MPIGLGVVGIAVVLPCGDFLDEGLFIGNPTVEALGGENAEFGLCQIKPTTVLWSVVHSKRSTSRLASAAGNAS